MVQGKSKRGTYLKRLTQLVQSAQLIQLTQARGLRKAAISAKTSKESYVINPIVLFLPILFCVYFTAHKCSIDAYADYNNNIYGEDLTFDSEGNLIMTTHDRKATTSVTYKTAGFVIKRFDMPMYAEYQQYVILPIGNDVQYTEDESDSSYIYCRYRIDESYIASAVERVSKEWFNQLYAYGEYVYIDEIMTVAEAGAVKGGLTDNALPYGEVYFDYEGISTARVWASKDSLKTHFDKQVYFSPKQNEKSFKYDYSVVAHTVLNNHVDNRLNITAGTRYVTDYDITKAVPVGARLGISGYADTFKYNIDISRIRIDFYIPIKLIVNYTLIWTRYDGTIAQEQKKVEKWYYVKKSVSYHEINSVDVKYLTSLSVSNYAFEGNKAEEAIRGCRPELDKEIYGEYYNHIIFPEYSDVYCIQGGQIESTGKRGVKPSVPDEDFQRRVEAEVGEVKVKNDRLTINNKIILADTLCKTNAPSPQEGNLSVKKSIYFNGYTIPYTKSNSRDNISEGKYVYTDYDTGRISEEAVTGIESITIHTPVYINGGIVNNIVDSRESIINFDEKSVDKVYIDNEFKVDMDNYGRHIDAKGYRLRDYGDMTGKAEIKFSCDVIADGEAVLKDTWILFTPQTSFRLPVGTVPGTYDMAIRVYAKNSIALSDNIEGHIQDTANLDINYYAAETTGKITAEYMMTRPTGNIVGTH